ncbi:unknown [Acidaminococcus intestini CAG:325]|nr:unknown [Acidaminococcus intestini CAG:325]
MIKLQGGVDACHKALGRCFFVATRAVCLPAAKEPLDGFMFEACRKLQGIEAVILNRISSPHHLAVLQTRNGLHESNLDFGGERGAHALDIDFIGPEPFRFQKKLMTALIGKTDDFCFNARAVARAYTFDGSVEHAAPVKVVPNDLMGPGVGIGQVTRNLLTFRNRADKGEIPHRFITVLRLGPRKINGPTVHTSRCTGLEAHERKPGFHEGIGQFHG